MGGGAGAYALSLAQDGHSVHLIEPVPLLVDQAREDAEREGIALARCDVGDARSLPGADGSADVVLLLGPRPSARSG